MDPYFSLLCASSLFANIEPDNIEVMLGCLDAKRRSFKKGEVIFRSGTSTTSLGLVLEGAVRVEKVDYWGNRDILTVAQAGQTFGEVYACNPGLVLDIDAVAAEDAHIMLLDVGRITTVCSSNCVFHTQLIRNLLGLIAKRAYTLTRKIDHTGQRTTRDKLLSYLSDQAKYAQSNSFVIPFDRQELADYLSVDRSAMCAEMSRMKKEGVITYQRNLFELFL